MNQHQLGSYFLQGLLGQGGMGSLCAARHQETGQRVAVKVLTGGRDADPRTQERFRREIEALGQLDHPGLIGVLESGETQGCPWFAMPLLEVDELLELALCSLPIKQPHDLAGPLSDVVEIAAGTSASAALTANGEVWSWGTFGRTGPGNGGRSPSYSPVQVKVLP